MKKIILIILTLISKSIYSQTTKPLHFSVIQTVSTEGLESKNINYNFSFNLLSGTVKNIYGIEIGGLYNQNNGKMQGAQFSGLVNITKENVLGYQTAGLVNIADNVVGMQNAGLASIAKNVKGVQISGIFNKAKVLNGLQIGLINVADSISSGGSIGLINVVKKNGYREIEFSVSDYQNIGLSYKTGVKAFYTIFNVGYNFVTQPLFISGFGFGRIVEIKKKFIFKPEIIGLAYLDDFSNAKKGANAIHFRTGFMHKQNKIGITIMPSIYYTNTCVNNKSGIVETNAIKPFHNQNKHSFGFGIGLGISLLK